MKAYQAEDTENGGLNDGINGGLNKRKILTLIALPTVTVREMADMLGFLLRQCERLIAERKFSHLSNILFHFLPFLSDFLTFVIILRNTIYGNLGHIHKK